MLDRAMDHDIAAPWLALPTDRRRLTVAQMCKRCRSLPPPGTVAAAAVADPLPAALLVPVIDHHGEAAVILTKRPSTMRRHGGDWVFPGGRVDERDASSVAAARREAYEELGVAPDRLTVVGQLDSHGPIMTGFVIDVFVGTVAGGELRPDPDEVADVAVVPLSALMAEGAYYVDTVMPDHDPGPTVGRLLDDGEHARELRFFTFRDGELAWGTQANIIYQLLAHLTSPRTP